MRVVFKEVGKPHIVTEIANELPVFQELVGGYIEVVPISEEVILICNEEGAINGFPFNQNVFSAFASMLIPIYGNYILCETEGMEFTDISEENAKKYEK